MEASQGSDDNEPKGDNAYSSPSDPCPSPKRRKKEADSEEGDEDYVPRERDMLCKLETPLLRSCCQVKKANQLDDVTATTSDSKRSAVGKAKQKGERGASIVRDNIPITIKDFDHISEGDKKHLWVEIKKRV
uniref:Uncharacterized protein n=1 Tax=Oryza punctata TaxID=4537 RepID=A0A0E0KN08_ORYPU